MAGTNSRYPRPLTRREKDLVDWVLPADRPGYLAFRSLLDTMVVLGEGRRGRGNIVLGLPGNVPDTATPLPPVFAYGVVETNFGPVSITLRESAESQIDIEIVGHRTEVIPDELEESRRWTYSTWNPGDACPQCGRITREVPMHSGARKKYVLAICAPDKRLWVFDSETQVNHPIPVTNFYNELVLHKNIRDPKAALDSNRLFSDVNAFTDADLTYAFQTYNRLKTRVDVTGTLVADRIQKRSLGHRLRSLLSGKTE